VCVGVSHYPPRVRILVVSDIITPVFNVFYFCQYNPLCVIRSSEVRNIIIIIIICRHRAVCDNRVIVQLERQYIETPADGGGGLISAGSRFSCVHLMRDYILLYYYNNTILKKLIYRSVINHKLVLTLVRSRQKSS